MRATTAYYLFGFVSSFGFAMTFAGYVPFLGSIGLDYADVSYLNAAFSLMIVIAEVPTGLLADGRSRAWSLVAGSICMALGSGLYFYATGWWSALAAELVIGTGMAFCSGAQQAWLADVLAAEGNGDQLNRAYGTAAAFSGAALLIGGLLGGLLVAWDMRAIWLAGVVSGIAAAFIAARAMTGRGESAHQLTEWEALKQALHSLASSPSLRWMGGCLATCGLVGGFNYYWSVYAQADFGLSGLGIVWAAIYLPCVAAGLLLRRTNGFRGREGRAVVLALGVAGLTLALLPFAKGRAAFLLVVCAHELPRGMLNPLVSAFITPRVGNGYRATAESLQSLMSHLGFVLFPFLIGSMVRGLPEGQDTVRLIWTVSGAALVLSSAVLWLFRPRSA